MKKISLLIQVNADGKIPDSNLPFLWKLYEGKPSFRSYIADNIVIMSEKFYDALPTHIRPLPCTYTVVITERPIVSRAKNIISVETLEQALTYQPDHLHPKEHFVVGCPKLYEYSLLLPKAGYAIKEIIIARTDGPYKGSVKLPDLGKEWVKKLLHIVPQDRDNPFEFRFISHRAA